MSKLTINDIALSQDRKDIFDAVLEEACRRWCDFFKDGDCMDRTDGEGFAEFFYDTFEDVEKDYLENLAAKRSVSGEGESAEAAIPQCDNVMALTIIRQRLSEGECWSDTYYIPLSDEEYEQQSYLQNPDPEAAAKEMVLARLHKHMASLEGWRAVCQASQDFNWGDSVGSGILAKACGDLGRQIDAKRTCIRTIVVDQDALIAPPDVPVTFCGMRDNRVLWTAKATLDMRDGNIELEGATPHGLETYGCERAYVALENGDRLNCDPDEGFLRLVQI